jgi:hypothetical protein
VLLACHRGANRSGTVGVGVLMAAAAEKCWPVVHYVRKLRKIVCLSGYHGEISGYEFLQQNERALMRCWPGDTIWHIPEEQDC